MRVRCRRLRGLYLFGGWSFCEAPVPASRGRVKTMNTPTVANFLKGLPWFISWAVLCKCGFSHNWGKTEQFGVGTPFQLSAWCGTDRDIRESARASLVQ